MGQVPVTQLWVPEFIQQHHVSRQAWSCALVISVLGMGGAKDLWGLLASSLPRPQWDTLSQNTRKTAPKEWLLNGLCHAHTGVYAYRYTYTHTNISINVYMKILKNVFSYFLKYSQVWVQKRCNKQPIFFLCDKKTDMVTSYLSSLCVGTSKGLRQRCIGYGIVTQDHEKKVLNYDNCPE